MKCINADKFMYTGKEMSPLGIGYCAENESVSTQMIGKDEKEWIVSIKNGRKMWVRAPSKDLNNDDGNDKKHVKELKKSDKHSKKLHDELQNDTSDEDDDKPLYKHDKHSFTKKEAPIKTLVKQQKKNLKIDTSDEDDDDDEDDDKPVYKNASKKAESIETLSKKEIKLTETIIKIKPPSIKASKYEEGYEDVGSDDTTIYIVKLDKNDKHRWAKKPVGIKKTTVSKTKEKSDDGEKVKKDRVKRGPTKYNLFIGAQLRKLRKEEPDLKNTDYMKLAIDMWNNMSDDQKNDVIAAA